MNWIQCWSLGFSEGLLQDGNASAPPLPPRASCEPIRETNSGALTMAGPIGHTVLFSVMLAEFFLLPFTWWRRSKKSRKRADHDENRGFYESSSNSCSETRLPYNCKLPQEQARDFQNSFRRVLHLNLTAWAAGCWCWLDGCVYDEPFI
jgi:hypothetical protein